MNKQAIIITWLIIANVTAMRTAQWPDVCKVPRTLLEKPTIVNDKPIDCGAKIKKQCTITQSGDYANIPGSCLDSVQAECQPSACLADAPDGASASVQASVDRLNARSEKILLAIQNNDEHALRTVQTESTINEYEKNKAEEIKNRLKARKRANLQLFNKPHVRSITTENLMMTTQPIMASTPATPQLICFKNGVQTPIGIAHDAATNTLVVSADNAGNARDVHGNPFDLTNCQFCWGDQFLELSHVKFQGTQSAKLKLSGAVFSASLLDNITFDHCKMIGTQFSTSIMTNVQFSRSDLRNSSFNFAEFDQTTNQETFKLALADNSDFSAATFSGTTLYYFNVSHAIFTGSTWNNALFKMLSDLSGASFVASQGTGLQMGDDQTALDLSAANFNQSTIRNLSFIGPNIYNPIIIKDVSFDGITSTCAFKNVQISATCTLPAPSLDQVKKGDEACK